MTTKLAFDNPDVFGSLCGPADKRLKLIERELGASLHVRGLEITLRGEPSAIALAEQLLTQLYGLVRRGQALGSDDVVRAIRILQADATAQLRTIFSDTVLVPKAGRPITPKGLSQKRYVDAARSHDICFGIGPAGTGKTYLAVALAAHALSEKQVKRIVLTRPALEAGERLGFLPGSLEEKINPYLRPLYDALFEMLSFERTRALIDQEVIEVAPLAFMRGRTLNDSFVIFDEAQNSTPEQMKMFLTRLGFGSRAMVTGDVTQTDLPKGSSTGLGEARRLLSEIKGIAFCEFTEADVVRHPLVQKIITAWDNNCS